MASRRVRRTATAGAAAAPSGARSAPAYANRQQGRRAGSHQDPGNATTARRANAGRAAAAGRPSRPSRVMDGRRARRGAFGSARQWRRRECAEAHREIVAAVFPLDANAARQPPTRRAIEEHRFDEGLQQVHRVVVAADVRDSCASARSAAASGRPARSPAAARPAEPDDQSVDERRLNSVTARVMCNCGRAAVTRCDGCRRNARDAVRRSRCTRSIRRRSGVSKSRRQSARGTRA